MRIRRIGADKSKNKAAPPVASIAEIAAAPDFFASSESAFIHCEDVHILSKDVRNLREDAHIFSEDARNLREDVHILRRDEHIFRRDVLIFGRDVLIFAYKKVRRSADALAAICQLLRRVKALVFLKDESQR